MDRSESSIFRVQAWHSLEELAQPWPMSIPDRDCLDQTKAMPFVFNEFRVQPEKRYGTKDPLPSERDAQVSSIVNETLKAIRSNIPPDEDALDEFPDAIYEPDILSAELEREKEVLNRMEAMKNRLLIEYGNHFKLKPIEDDWKDPIDDDVIETKNRHYIDPRCIKKPKKPCPPSKKSPKK